MELGLHTISETNKPGSIDVSATVFDAELNNGLIHQVVSAYLSGARAGTKAQKSRSDVSGGGIKPWRQKGTGRARAGTSRSPLWRSGGVTFAASPRDHSQKVNRKMYRGAVRSILSELNRQGRLLAVDDFTVSEPKTRELINMLASLGKAKILLVIAGEDKNLFLAARNLHYVTVKTASEIDPVSLVEAGKVIVTCAALKQIEEKLA